jgi:hypothetical protein
MFGTIDNTASPSKTNLLLNGTTFVKTSLKLLDGSSAGGGYTMYFIPPVGTTLEIIPNWVVGQGAVGTAGSTVSAIVIGYSSFPDLGTTRYPSKLYTGNLDVASGTLDMTNTVTTVTNLQTQYATYGNRVINLTGAVITTTGNFPGFFQGYNVSIIYNSATNIIITNSSSDCNIGYVSTTGLTSLPTFTINTTRQVICNGGTYENIVASSGQTLTLASSYTNIFKKLTLTGTAVNPVIVKSNVHPSTRATLQRNGGYQDFTGVTFQSINFTGSALARAWSSTNSNTVGITFKTGKKTPESSFLSLC